MRTSDLGKQGFRHVFIIEVSQDVKGGGEMRGGKDVLEKKKVILFWVDGGNSK